MTDTRDLATGPVLLRAADTLVQWGHIKDDHIDNEDGGYDAAGAIADAAGLDAADWDPCPVPPIYQGKPVYAEGDWERRRAAALAALRTLAGHLDPESRPEAMSRREVVEWVGTWNDDEQRTAAQVVTAMRNAAREEVGRG
jgi:hypothetical protein